MTPPVLVCSLMVALLEACSTGQSVRSASTFSVTVQAKERTLEARENCANPQYV